MTGPVNAMRLGDRLVTIVGVVPRSSRAFEEGPHRIVWRGPVAQRDVQNLRVLGVVVAAKPFTVGLDDECLMLPKLDCTANVITLLRVN